MTGIEEQNRYNAKAYDAFGENEDISFLPELEAFEDWLDTAETRKGGRHSAKAKYKTIKDVKRYFAAMETLSEENVKLYKNGMRDADMAVSYINSGIISIKQYIKFLSQKYNAPHLVQFKTKTIAIQPKQFIDNVISRADYDFLIAETKKDTKHPNVYLGARIMGTTGVRRCELLQVKVEHIKHGYVDVIGKGGKQRRIYFPKNAREELLDYLAQLGVDSGYVIRRWNKTDKKTYLANTRDGGDISEALNFERAINTQFERAGEKYGISKELMHPHGFRHFFCKRVFEKPFGHFIACGLARA